jgi:hypothetical protein
LQSTDADLNSTRVISHTPGCKSQRVENYSFFSVTIGNGHDSEFAAGDFHKGAQRLCWTFDFDISARSCALPSRLFMAGTLFITSQLPIKRYESLLSRLAGKLETFGEL